MTVPPAFATQGGPDVFGYTFIDNVLEPNGPLFAWEDSSAFTSTGMTCDDCSSAVLPIGFTFDFYGAPKTTVRACANGYIFFNLTTCSFTTQVIPTTFSPNNRIAGWHEDLHAGNVPTSPVQPRISFATLGAAPNQVFVIEYFAMSQFTTCRDPNGAPLPAQVNAHRPCRVSFQIKLFETSNDIEVHILEGISDRDAFSQETMGIENATGTDGLQYYRGDGTDFALRAIRYIHP